MEMGQKNGVIVLAIIIIVLGVLYWYWTELIPKSRGPIAVPQVSGPVGEDIIAKQLQELDALYKKSGVSPPSEAEISKQLKELEQLRMSK